MTDISDGFAPFPRAAEDIVKDKVLFQVYGYLVYKAKFKKEIVTYRSQRMELERGEVLVTKRIGARELGLPETTFRWTVKRLEKLELLTVKVDRNLTIVTIANYSGADRLVGPQVDHKWTGSGPVWPKTAIFICGGRVPNNERM